MSPYEAVHDVLHVSDLNLEMFEDSDLAEGVAADAIQLFQQGEATIDQVRTAVWYRRLWATTTWGETRKTAHRLSSVPAAQAFFKRMLKAHVDLGPRSHALLTHVAGYLGSFEAPRTPAVEAILRLAEPLLRPNDSIAGEHLAPYHWSEAQQLLLYKAMVLAAHANHDFDPPQASLLQHKLTQLALSEQAIQEGHAFFAHPHSVDEQLEGLEDEATRLVFFRHILGMLFADGKLDLLERLHMHRMAGVLRVREPLLSRTIWAFTRLHGDISVGDLTSFVTRLPGLEVEPREVSDRLLPVSEVDRQQAEDHTRETFRSLVPRWASFTAHVVSWAMMAPVLNHYAAFVAVKSSDVRDWVQALDARALHADVSAALPGAFELMERYLEDWAEFIELPTTAYSGLDLVWDTMLADDAGWEPALMELYYASIDLLEATEALTDGGFVGSSLGNLPNLRTAFSACRFATEAEKQRFDATAWRWKCAYESLIKVSDIWRERATHRLEAYWNALIAELEGDIASLRPVARAQDLLDRLDAHMNGEAVPMFAGESW